MFLCKTFHCVPYDLNIDICSGNPLGSAILLRQKSTESDVSAKLKLLAKTLPLNYPTSERCKRFPLLKATSVDYYPTPHILEDIQDGEDLLECEESGDVKPCTTRDKKILKNLSNMSTKKQLFTRANSLPLFATSPSDEGHAPISGGLWNAPCVQH